MVINPVDRTDIDSKRRARNAFIIGLIMTIASVLIVTGTLLLQATSGENYYAWITAVAGVGGIITMILSRRNNILASTIVMVISLFIIAAFYVFTFESIGTMMALIVIILSLGIVIQTLPQEKLGRAIIIVMVIGIGLVVLDQFWPTKRVQPPPYAETIIFATGAITILAMAFILIKQFPTYSLRGKLIGATLAVALIAVAAVAVGVTLMTTNTITEQVGNNLGSTASTQSLTVGEYLARIVTGLETLSSNRTVQDLVVATNQSRTGADEEIAEQLKVLDGTWATTSDDGPFIKSILDNDAVAEFNKYQAIFPDAFEVIAVDKHGALVAATSRPDDFYEGEEEWFLDSYINGFGSTYISNPLYDAENDEWLIYVAVPMHTSKEGGGGEISGVIRAAVYIEPLVDILAAGAFGETGHIELYFPFLFDEDTDDIGGALPAELQEHVDGAIKIDGTGEEDFVMLAIETDALGEFNIHLADLVPEIEAMLNDSTTNYILGEHHEEENFISAANTSSLANIPAVDSLKWIITTFQESSESLQPVAEQQRLNTILGMIVIISAGAVAYYVGTSLSQPITNLTKVAEQVADGDFSAQAEVESQDEIGQLAISFNAMTGQLRDSITTLEQRVQNRTQALATTVKVGQKLSTILDEDELITAVVNQVRESFDYYQAQIYLLAEDKQTLIMAAGTGKAGEQMVADGHQLQVGTGLVGRAADTNVVVVVPDTSQEAGWLANPLLPDTKSETAVPIAIGDEILGVLDVQHNIVNGLKQEDADLLRSVANQVAVALRNSRLYKETQQQAQQEALLRSINQKISSTTDMETAMKVAIRELGQATGSPETNVRLKIGRQENNH